MGRRPANEYFQQSLGGVGNVPVEEDGGQASAGAHLDESVFDAELMTGFSENTNMPLSKLTAYMMADMGWKVDPESSVVEAYALPGAAAVHSSGEGCCSAIPLKEEDIKQL